MSKTYAEFFVDFGGFSEILRKCKIKVRLLQDRYVNVKVKKRKEE